MPTYQDGNYVLDGFVTEVISRVTPVEAPQEITRGFIFWYTDWDDSVRSSYYPPAPAYLPLWYFVGFLAHIGIKPPWVDETTDYIIKSLVDVSGYTDRRNYSPGRLPEILGGATALANLLYDRRERISNYYNLEIPGPPYRIIGDLYSRRRLSSRGYTSSFDMDLRRFVQERISVALGIPPRYLQATDPPPEFGYFATDSTDALSKPPAQAPEPEPPALPAPPPDSPPAFRKARAPIQPVINPANVTRRQAKKKDVNHD